MKLIHKQTGEEAHLGDTVFSRGTGRAVLIYAAKPHKPSSEGKVQVRWDNNDQPSHELYCSVFNLEWIEREDRQEDSVASHEQLTEDYLGRQHH